MIISKLRLVNWKNFKSIEVNLNERTFIVGPNASGKSNLLDALRFLRDISQAGGGLQKAINEQRGGVSKVRCLSARNKPEIEIDVTLSEFGSREELWRYSIGIIQESRGRRRTLLKHEKVWQQGNLILNRPLAEDKKDDERLTQTHLEQINSNVEFREIARFFDDFLYLHLVPQLLKYKNAFQGSDLPGDPFGRGFLERIANTKEKRRDNILKRIDGALQIAVPQLKNLAFKKDKTGEPHLAATYVHWRPDAGIQQEEQFSDGTLRLIGLFWTLFESDGLLLLEEPELSLNGAIVSRLASLFHQVQKNKKRQIIITTHSSELLNDRGIALEEIILLDPQEEGTNATQVSNIREIKILLESGISPSYIVMPKTSPKRINQLALF